MTLTPIGIIRSPHQQAARTPVQSAFAPGVKGNILHIEDVDVLDGTPLLDIKPYVPRFDVFEAKRVGWLTELERKAPLADGRFEAAG